SSHPRWPNTSARRERGGGSLLRRPPQASSRALSLRGGATTYGCAQTPRTREPQGRPSAPLPPRAFRRTPLPRGPERMDLDGHAEDLHEQDVECEQRRQQRAHRGERDAGEHQEGQQRTDRHGGRQKRRAVERCDRAKHGEEVASAHLVAQRSDGAPELVGDLLEQVAPHFHSPPRLYSSARMMMMSAPGWPVSSSTPNSIIPRFCKRTSVSTSSRGP